MDDGEKSFVDDEGSDLPDAIAARIRSTPALTFADIVPKLAILKDCYESIADLAEAVRGVTAIAPASRATWP